MVICMDDDYINDLKIQLGIFCILLAYLQGHYLNAEMLSLEEGWAQLSYTIYTPSFLSSLSPE